MPSRRELEEKAMKIWTHGATVRTNLSLSGRVSAALRSDRQSRQTGDIQPEAQRPEVKSVATLSELVASGVVKKGASDDTGESGSRIWVYKVPAWVLVGL